jgi:prolipoprotein diacylglyceryl transferase
MTQPMSALWTLLSIPSPSEGVWHLGPLPIRAYALAIILGVIAAVWTGERRWVARGGTHGQIGDIALWAVPAGLIGARAYHVATDHDLYFGKGGDPVGALEIWHGGLGIWGAIAGGLLGAWFYCRRHRILIRPLADALAPSLLLAQAIGRLGNYFNQELYGRPTELPWGLEIDSAHWPRGTSFPAGTVFHPTFLYEAIWNLVGIALLLYLDRRFKLGYGRVFALYVMIYTSGRGWIETLRIDTIELDNVLGLRWGVWMSIVLFVLAAVYFVVAGRRHPRPDSREPSPYVDGRAPDEQEEQKPANGSMRGTAADAENDSA